MATIYEWDYETIEDGGFIADHNHADKLSDFRDSDKTDTLVLVRNTGNENNGLQERLWAYVLEGKLPEYFSDGLGEPTLYKVPQRFHAELSKYLITQ